MAKKLAAICLVLVMVLTTLGASYATWTQNLITNATVSIAQAPEVVASGANANTTSAVLNGSLSQEAPGGAPVSVGFEYWKQGDSLNKTPVAAGSVSSLNGTFSANIAGLSPDTTYEYQSTGVGFFTVESATSTFTTGAAAVLEVTTSALPDGTVNSPYNQTLQASGGSGSYTGWAIVGGSLPGGLSLTDGNVISGTPTTAGNYSVTFRVTDSTSATADSVSLSIAINAAATKLAFSQQPTGTTPGTAISPTVTVRVEDPAGNLITTSSALISIAINTNPSSGTLSGMQSVHAVNGVAAFKYLSIDKTGIGYTLTASSSGLSSATSNAFNIGTRTTNYISIETLANGSGVVIPAQSFVAGNGGTITAFAIERNTSGTFVANVSATWSLTNITGGVVNTDLVPSGDDKSATFTDTVHLVGTATLHAVWNGLSADSATITITPNVINKLVVTLPGQIFTAGTGNSGTVTAQSTSRLFNIISITATDAYYNIATSYSGAKTLSYSGPAGSPVYTTAVNFTSGISTTALATRLSNAETTTITVNDGTTSGPASSSLTVTSGTPVVYVPFTLTNTQTTAVAGETQVSLTMNWLNYYSYLDNPVDNYGFFDSAGNPLYSWLESGTSNTSTSAVVWLKLNSSGIPAKVGSTNGTITVYLGFYPKSTNKLGSNNNNYTGWAPNLSGTYGQYDNGANVFVSYYRGDSTSGWSSGGTPGQTGTTTAPAGAPSSFGTNALFANGLTGGTANNYLYIDAGYSGTGNYVIQYNTYTTNTTPASGSLGNFCFSTDAGGLGTQSRIDTRASSYSGLARTASWTDWNAPVGTNITNNINTWYQWSIVIAGNGTQIGDYYTTTFGLSSLGSQINALNSTYDDSKGTPTYTWSGSYIGLSGDRLATSTTTYWNGILIRVYPPNGVMPTSSTGSPVTTVTPATINVDSNINWSAITTGSGIGGQPSVFDTVNVGITNNTTLTVDVPNAVCADLNLGHYSADKTGTLVFNNGSNLSVNNLAIGASGAGASGAGNLTMTLGGTLNVAGTVTINQGGTWAPGTGTVVYNGTADQTLPGTFLTSYNNLAFSNGGNKSASGSMTVGGNLNIGNGATFTSGSFTHNVAGNWTNNGGTFTNTGSTINFNGTNQTIAGTASTTFNNLSTSGSSNINTGIATTISGNLSIGDGTTFTAAAFDLTVSGTTTVGDGASGILTISSATGTKAFNDDVIVNTGATWNNTAANVALTLPGNFTNSGTFNAGTGIYTFSGTAKTISGSAATSIANVAITGTIANSNILTVGTALSGGGTLTNNGTLNVGGACSVTTLTNAGIVAVTGSGAISTGFANFTNTGTINLGGSGTIAGITNNAGGIVNLSSAGTITRFTNGIAGTLNISALTVPTITTLTVTAAGNIVNYNGSGAQTIKAQTYLNLTLSGSGIKFVGTGTLRINNKLSIAPDAGGATLNLAAATNARALFLGGTNRVAGTWGSTASTATNKNATYFGTTSTFNLTVAAISPFVAITAGPWATNGTWAGGTAPTAFDDTVINVAVSVGVAITQTGSVTINNGGTLTATAANATIGSLTINSGGTLTCSRVLTVNGNTNITGTANLSGARANRFNGDITLNSGAQWNDTDTTSYAISGNFTNNASTFSVSTAVYTFSGAGKTFSGTQTTSIPSLTISGIYTNTGTLTVGAALAGATGMLVNTGTLNIGGTSGTCSIGSTSGGLRNSGTIAVTGSGNITTALAYFINTGTLTLGGSGTITGITNNANGIVNLNSSGNITSFNNAASSSILNISALTVPTITTLTVTVAGNTVNYNGAGAQTVKASAYSNLVLSGSGAKTMLTGTSVSTGGNLSIAPTGSATASLGAGLNLGIYTLTLGGTAQPGTASWGSTSSAATNKTDTYFTAGTTGILTVIQ